MNSIHVSRSSFQSERKFGFTLVEVAIGTVILASAVLVVMLLLPNALQAQQDSRFKFIAAMHAQTTIDRFVQHPLDLQGQPYTPQELTGNPEQADSVYSWNPASKNQLLAQNVTRNRMLGPAGNYDLEQVIHLQRGNYPVPQNIALRLESPNDEIRRTIEQGGSLYYTDPLNLGIFDDRARAQGDYVGQAGDMQRLVWAVIGSPQQNILPYHPLEAKRYELYPFPPRALSQITDRVYVHDTPNNTSVTMSTSRTLLATVTLAAGEYYRGIRLTSPLTVEKWSYNYNISSATRSLLVDMQRRLYVADGSFRYGNDWRYDGLGNHESSGSSDDTKGQRGFMQANHWHWFAFREPGSAWDKGAAAWRRLIGHHWDRIRHQLSSIYVLPPTVSSGAPSPTVASVAIAGKVTSYVAKIDADGRPLLDAGGRAVTVAVESDVTVGFDSFVPGGGEPAVPPANTIREVEVSGTVVSPPPFTSSANSLIPSYRGYPRPSNGLSYSTLRGSDVLGEDGDGHVRNMENQLRISLPSLERRIMYRSQALALWAQTGCNGLDIVQHADASLLYLDTDGDGQAEAADGTSMGSLPADAITGAVKGTLPKTHNPLLTPWEELQFIDSSGTSRSVAKEGHLLPPAAIYALSHLAHAAVMVTGYKPPFVKDENTPEADDDDDLVGDRLDARYLRNRMTLPYAAVEPTMLLDASGAPAITEVVVRRQDGTFAPAAVNSDGTINLPSDIHNDYRVSIGGDVLELRPSASSPSADAFVAGARDGDRLARISYVAEGATTVATWTPKVFLGTRVLWNPYRVDLDQNRYNTTTGLVASPHWRTIAADPDKSPNYLSGRTDNAGTYVPAAFNNIQLFASATGARRVDENLFPLTSTLPSGQTGMFQYPLRNDGSADISHPITYQRYIDGRINNFPPPYADMGGISPAGYRLYRQRMVWQLEVDWYTGTGASAANLSQRRYPLYKLLPIIEFTWSGDSAPSYATGDIASRDGGRDRQSPIYYYSNGLHQDSRMARTVHESCLRTTAAWTSNHPYDLTVPRMANRANLMDYALWQWDHFDATGNARRHTGLTPAARVDARFGLLGGAGGDRVDSMRLGNPIAGVSTLDSPGEFNGRLMQNLHQVTFSDTNAPQSQVLRAGVTVGRTITPTLFPPSRGASYFNQYGPWLEFSWLMPSYRSYNGNNPAINPLEGANIWSANNEFNRSTASFLNTTPNPDIAWGWHPFAQALRYNRFVNLLLASNNKTLTQSELDAVAKETPNRSRFTATKAFEANMRTRQLVYWVVDWNRYRDVESAPSSPSDISHLPLVLSRYEFTIDSAVATSFVKSDPSWTNRIKIRGFRFPAPANPTEWDKQWALYASIVSNRTVQLLDTANATKPWHNAQWTVVAWDKDPNNNYLTLTFQLPSGLTSDDLDGVVYSSGLRLRVLEKDEDTGADERYLRGSPEQSFAWIDPGRTVTLTRFDQDKADMIPVIEGAAAVGGSISSTLVPLPKGWGSGPLYGFPIGDMGNINKSTQTVANKGNYRYATSVTDVPDAHYVNIRITKAQRGKNPFVLLGAFGADRNGNGRYDEGTIDPGVRLRAREVARFNYYDPIIWLSLAR